MPEGRSWRAVDYDPFAPAAEPAARNWTPVDFDPFGDEPTTGDRLANVGPAIAQGFTSTAAGMAKGVALADRDRAVNALTAMDRIERGEDVKFDPGEYPESIIPDLIKFRQASPEERASLRAAIESRMPSLDPRKSMLYRAGESVEQFGRETFQTDPRLQDELLASKLPQGVGSLTAFATTGLLARGAGARPLSQAGVVAGTGAAVNSAAQFEDALRKGASLETAFRAADIGALVGTTEAIPISRALSRLDKLSGGTVSRILVETVKGGTEEAIQEATTSILNNLTARGLYDPERGVLQGAGDDATVGFTTGSLLSFITSLAGARRAGPSPFDDLDPTSFTDEQREEQRKAAAAAFDPNRPPPPEPPPAAPSAAAAPATPQQPTVTLGNQALPDEDAMPMVDDDGRETPGFFNRTTGQWRPALERTLDGEPVPVAPDNVTREDVASPIPTDVISEGRAIMDEVLGETTAPALPAPPALPALPAPQRSGATTTEGAGFTMRGEEQPQRALPPPTAFAPPATPVAGQGFYTEQPAARPAESAAPVVKLDGTAFATEGSARLAARQRPDLKGRALEPVQVQGGWGLRAAPADVAGQQFRPMEAVTAPRFGNPQSDSTPAIAPKYPPEIKSNVSNALPVDSRPAAAPEIISGTDRPIPAASATAPTQTEAPPAPTSNIDLENRLRAYIGERKSLVPAAVAKALGTTPEAASRALATLAKEPKSPFYQVRGKLKAIKNSKGKVVRREQSNRAGTFAYRPVRKGPIDLATVIAEAGGIRDDEGHDLSMGRGLRRGVPGVGAMIRPSGMSVDETGEYLWERGWFGPPSQVARPDVPAVLDLLDRMQGGKVYHPDEAAEVAQSRTSARQAEEQAGAEADARAEIEVASKGIRFALSDAESAEAVRLMLVDGLPAADAIAEAIEGTWATYEGELAAEADPAQTVDPEEIPFDVDLATEISGGQADAPSRGPAEGPEARTAGRGPADRGQPGEGQRDAGEAEGRGALEGDLEAFARTLPGRTSRVPQKTFNQFLADNGVAPLSDAEEADYVGGLFSGSTLSRQERGRVKSLGRRAREIESLRDEYQAAVASGAIPSRDEVVPLDLTRESDRAYVRVQMKRQKRAAEARTERTDQGENFVLGGTEPVSREEVQRRERDAEAQRQFEVRQRESRIRRPGQQSVRDQDGGLFSADRDQTDIFSQRDAPAETAAPPEPDDPALFQAAWHGSPYHFDAFTLSKIGTGEGAQAYGWGLYFAGNRKVAEFYRNKLGTPDPEVTYEGQTFLRADGKQFVVNEDWRGDLLRMLEHAVDNNLTPAQILAEETQRDNQTGVFGAMMGRGARFSPKLMQLLVDKGVTVGKTPGRLFKVDLAPAEDEWLDWDKPVEEQSESVRNAVHSIHAELEARHEDTFLDYLERKNIDSLLELTGKELYSVLRRAALDDMLPWDAIGDMRNEGDHAEGASLYLKARGIPGIRYLDGSSRGKGVGSHNFVVFDEALIKIEEAFRRPSATINRPPAEDTEFEPRRRRVTVGRRTDAESTARRERLAAALKRWLRKVAPDADLQVVDDILSEDGERQLGYFDQGFTAADSPIFAAMDSADPMGTVSHELIHFLKRLGYLTKTEWNILASKARSAGWVGRFQIRERGYPESLWEEEAVAEAFSAWKRGELEATGTIDRIFKKIAEFLERLGSAIRGEGFTSAEDLFRAIESGEIGTRGRTASSAASVPGMVPAFESPAPRQAFPADFPLVVIQQPDSSPTRVRAHPDYAPAKAGNMGAAMRLVDYALSDARIARLRQIIGNRKPVIVAVNSIEASGRNKIPLAYAKHLGERLGLPVDTEIIHANSPKRTGASALHRMTARSVFDGEVEAGRDYLLVDDHITQGGTLADLRAYIEERGGRVIAATTLTGNDKSTRLAPLPATIARLRERFPGLEQDWKRRFGYGFDGLTQSEAVYLDRFNSAQSIRDNVLARGNEEGGGGSGRLAGRAQEEDGGLGEDPVFQRPLARWEPDTTAPDDSVVDILLDSSRGVLERLKDAASTPALRILLDRARVKVQDQMLAVRRAQEGIAAARGESIPESQDVYLAEELYSGRTGDKLLRFDQDLKRPLLEAIRDSGLSLAEVELWLYARHAKERNAQIGKVNPAFKPGEGSGMTDAEADDVLKKAREAGHQAKLEKIGERIDAITRFAMSERVDGGLLSQADADLWMRVYPHFMPLRGRDDLEGGRPIRAKTGRGYDVQGKESKRATGRRTKARDLLAHAIMLAEEAVVRAEKNRVNRALYELVKANPDPDYWTIDKVRKQPVVSSSTGLVSYRETDRLEPEVEERTVRLKIGGEEHRITMEDPALARAMKKVGVATADRFLRGLMKIGIYLSAINTKWNFEFPITNAMKDAETAAVTMQALNIKSLAKATFRDYRKALAAVWRAQREKAGDGEWDKWHREYAANGGRVAFFQIDDIDAQRTNLERELKRVSGTGSMPIETARAVFKFVEDINASIDNAVRLSAYANARRAGLTKLKAASLAKNLTVNFNRKGEWGPVANALYLFFNAGVQGTAVVLRSLQHPKVRRIVAGMVVAGFASELMNAMVSGDADGDGDDEYDEIPHHQKSRNLIIMLPEGSPVPYLQIPMSYGFNVFWELGRNVAAMARGKQTVGQTIGNLANTFADSFIPLDNGSLENFVTPTLLDPAVDLLRNEDFAGRPIMPEGNPYGPDKPDSQRFYPGANSISKAVAAKLNELTGGNEFKPGAIDISPETIDHYLAFWTGGAGSFVQRLARLPEKVMKGEPISANDIPFVRRVVGSINPQADVGRFYERADTLEQLRVEYDGLRKAKRFQEAAELRAEHPAALDESLGDKAKDVRKELREIRTERQAIHANERIGSDAKQARLEGLASRERRAVNEFNRRYVREVLKPEQRRRALIPVE